MSNNLHMLPLLKKKLVQATEFNKVFHYFFDHFGENREFMALGEAYQSREFESLIGHIAGQLLGTRVVLMQLLLIHLPKQQFVHGTAQINGRLASFFYFEDIKVGMMALLGPHPDAETKFTRFSGMYMPPSKPKPFPN
jgi:hypothetical protein